MLRLLQGFTRRANSVEYEPDGDHIASLGSLYGFAGDGLGLPVQQGLDGYRGPMARSFGSAIGVPGLAGLVASLFWGLVSIIAGGPSSNSQQVGGNIRDTGGVYAAIQRRHLSFTCDAQQPA